MTIKKQKLELTWIGKDEELKLEPRILIEDPDKSYGDPSAENMLIHGDNLLALKALEQDFAGRIKCIYIDPPYNTGSAFEHYDDNLEHSTWLSLIRPRLEILKELLCNEGSIFIHLDDNEMHYAKVLCDEIFGRINFITTITWHKKRGKDNSSRYFSATHDFILVYAKNAKSFQINKVELENSTKKAYTNPDNDPRGNYRLLGLWSRKQGGSEYEFVMKDGKKFTTRLWLVNLESMKRLESDDRIVVKGDKLYRKLFLTENTGSIPETIWIGLSNNANAKDELKKVFDMQSDEELFDTPKPELLVSRIIEIATQPNEWVLDSFLGSGTTSAVAHKMGRKHIGIEFGNHANTHCLPRLKKVVDGNDGLALSETLGWKGGGGFKFYNLAPSLLKKDKYDQWIIDESYNANMLAAAMCKHEGFKFFPDQETYWKQGKSTETDYIFVTTAFVTAEQLDKMHEEMKEGESLLICAKSFAPECERRHSNITIKKIPQMILGRCEFDNDNYDLNIIQATEEIAEDQGAAEEV